MKQPIHRIQKLGTFGAKLNLKLLRSRKTPEDNRRIARWVTGELVDLGPTFVKLGQLISTRNDILSAEVIEEFSSLQNEVPPFQNVLSVVGEITCATHLDISTPDRWLRLRWGSVTEPSPKMEPRWWSRCSDRG